VRKSYTRPYWRTGKPVKAKGASRSMHVLLRTNDLVRLSFLQALLLDAGIEPLVLDSHASATDGSIGAIPRRLAVAAEDGPAAERILQEAGEADWT
jgi:hypothetical protein